MHKQYGDPVDFIREKLSKEELLAQLAEECAELGKAALKLRRVYDGKNPTPVKRAEAYRNLVEEIADISLCLEVLDLNTPKIMFDVQKTINMKLKRWAMRLEEVECPVCGETIKPRSKDCPNCRVYLHDPDDFIGEYEEENG
jgi:hypothetical protein